MLLLCPFYYVFRATLSFMLMVYNGQIKMHCWHYSKFFCLFMAKQFSTIKHPFLKFNCALLSFFFAQNLEILSAWYLSLYLPLPISFFPMWLFLGPVRGFFTILFLHSILLIQQVHIRPSFGQIVLQYI